MNPLSWWTANFGLPFEIIGTIGFALSGLIEAARKKLDVVGVCMVTAVAAFGGGTLRDILLNRRPLFWVQNDWWIWAILIFCVLAFVFVRGRHLEFTERAMQWPDAIGLGVFAASGTQIALTSGNCCGNHGCHDGCVRWNFARHFHESNSSSFCRSPALHGGWFRRKLDCCDWILAQLASCCFGCVGFVGDYFGARCRDGFRLATSAVAGLVISRL